MLKKKKCRTPRDQKRSSASDSDDSFDSVHKEKIPQASQLKNCRYSRSPIPHSTKTTHSAKRNITIPAILKLSTEKSQKSPIPTTSTGEKNENEKHETGLLAKQHLSPRPPETPATNKKNTRSSDQHALRRRHSLRVAKRHKLAGIVDCTTKIDSSQLPLALFDSSISKEKSDSEQQIRKAFHEVAKSPLFVDGAFVWADCKILSYDASTDKFIIEFVEQSIIKEVGRLSILLQTDDPKMHLTRRNNCFRDKSLMKSFVRYNFLIDKQDDGKAGNLNKSSRERIVQLAIGTKNAPEYIKQNYHSLSQLMREIETEFKFAIKRSFVRNTLVSNVSGDYLSLHINNPCLKAAKLNAPFFLPSGSTVFFKARKLMSSVKVNLNAHPLIPTLFQRIFELSDESLTCKSFIVRVSHDKFGIAKINDMVELPCSIDNFFEIQSKHCSQLLSRISTNWRNEVAFTVEHMMSKLWDSCSIDRKYQNSFQTRLKRKVDIILSSHLRQLILRSLDDWKEFVGKYFRQETCLNDADELFSSEYQSTPRLDPHSLEFADQLKLHGDRFVNILNKVRKRQPKTQILSALVGDARLSVSSLLGRSMIFRKPVIVVKLILQNKKVLLDPPQTKVIQIIDDIIKDFTSSCQSIDAINNFFDEGRQCSPKKLIDVNSFVMSSQREFWNAGKISCPLTSRYLRKELNSSMQLAKLYENIANSLIISIDKCDFSNQHFMDEKSSAVLSPPRCLISKKMFEHILKILEQYRSAIKEVQLQSHDVEVFGFLEVNCREVKEAIVVESKYFFHSLNRLLEENCFEENRLIIERYESMLANLTKIPKSEEDLDEQWTYMIDIDEKLHFQITTLQEISSRYIALQTMYYPVSDIHINFYLNSLKFGNSLKAAISDCRDNFEKAKSAMMEKLRIERIEFENQLSALDDTSFAQYKDLSKFELYSEEVMIFDEKLTNFRKKAEEFNYREKILGWLPHKYDALDKIYSFFSPYYTFWTVASAFYTQKGQWLHLAMEKLDANKISKSLCKWIQQMDDMKKVLDSNLSVQESLNSLSNDINEFYSYFPLIESLSSSVIKTRHWEKLQLILPKLGEKMKSTPEVDTITNIESEEAIDSSKVVVNEQVNLEILLQCDAFYHLDTISLLMKTAVKEYEAEKSLMDMIHECEDFIVATYEYSERSDLLLVDEKDCAELILIIENQLVQVEIILSSLYADSIEKKCIMWKNKLEVVHSFFLCWTSFQKLLFDIEPIFESKEMDQCFYRIKSKYVKLENTWISCMNSFRENVSFNKVFESQNIKKLFAKSIEKINELYRELHDYFLLKKKHFPRLFFLPDKPLIGLLSTKTKDFQTVFNVHVRTVFPGVSTLLYKTTNDNVTICSLVSFDGYVLELKDSISIFDSTLSSKNRKLIDVPRILLEVENGMKVSLIAQFCNSIKNFTQMNLKKWIHEYPQQIVYSSIQTIWTFHMEAAFINNSDPVEKDLLHWISEMSEEVQSLFKNIYVEKYESTKFFTISNVASQLIHLKDITCYLIENQVQNISEFDWQRQIRRYCVGELDTENKEHAVQLMDVRINYEYEFLSFGEEFFVSASYLDKLFFSVFNTFLSLRGVEIKCNSGFKQSTIINTITQGIGAFVIDFPHLTEFSTCYISNILAGIASSGAWLSIQQIPSLSALILSILATHILQIFQSLRQGATKIFFQEFGELLFNCKTKIFVTNSNGCIKNLPIPKALLVELYPTSVIPIGSGQFAFILLQSCGFSDFSKLSVKVVEAIKYTNLAGGNITHSMDLHIISLIIKKAASTLYSQEYDETNFVYYQNLSLLWAIEDVILPRVKYLDSLFIRNKLCSILEFEDEEEKDLKIDDILENYAEDKLKIYLTSPVIQRCKAINESLDIFSSFLVVGEAGTGKSTCLSVLCKYYCQDNEISLHVTKLFMEDIPTVQFMNLLVDILKIQNNDEQKRYSDSWLILDGTFDSIWIDNTSFENKSIKAFIETTSVDNLSPSFMCQTCVICFEESCVSWNDLLKTWLLGFPNQFEKLFLDYVGHLLTWLLPECLFIAQVSSTTVEVTLQTISELINEVGGWEHMKFKENRMQVVEGIIIFSIISSIGATEFVLQSEFDEKIRRILSGENFIQVSKDRERVKTSIPIPNDKPVFDYFFDYNTVKWRAWSTKSLSSVDPIFDISDTIKIFGDKMIVVPTIKMLSSLYFLNLKGKNKSPIICCGGLMGKSLSVKVYLHQLKYLQPQAASQYLLSSFLTTSNYLKSSIQSNILEAQKKCINLSGNQPQSVFIDDVHLCQSDSLELVREWKNLFGWYNASKNQFVSVPNIHFICSTSHRYFINTRKRLRRHFFILNYEYSAACEYTLCIEQICTELFKFSTSAFPLQFTSMMESALQATLELVGDLVLKFPSSPVNKHYVFTLKTAVGILLGIIRGFSQNIDAHYKFLERTLPLLWVHECQREIEDFMKNSDDVEKFRKTALQKVKKYFGKKQFSQVKSIFMQNGSIFCPNLDNLELYEQIPRLNSLCNSIESKKSEIEDFYGKELDIFKRENNHVFCHVVTHIARYLRIFTSQQHKNHAILFIDETFRAVEVGLELASWILKGKNLVFSYSKTWDWDDWNLKLKNIYNTMESDVFILIKNAHLLPLAFLQKLSLFFETKFPPYFYQNSKYEEEDATDAKITYESILKSKYSVHFCLLFPKTGGLCSDYLSVFPSLFSCCYIDHYRALSDEILIAAARSHFCIAPISDSQRESLSNACVYVCKILAKHLRKFSCERAFNNLASIFPNWETFNTFLSTANRLLTETWSACTSRENLLLIAIRRIKELDIRIKKNVIEINESNILIKAHRKEIENLNAEMLKVRDRISDAEKIVSDIEAIVKEENIQLQELNNNIEDQIKGVKAAYDVQSNIVRELSDKDLTNFRTRKSTLSSFTILQEYVSFLLQFGRHKSIKTSEGGIKDLCEINIPNIIGDIDKIAAITKLSETDLNIIAKQSIVAEQLGRWMISLVNYCGVRKKLTVEFDICSSIMNKIKLIRASSSVAHEEFYFGKNQIEMLECEKEVFASKIHQLYEKNLIAESENNVFQKFMGKFENEVKRWEEVTLQLNIQKQEIPGCSVASSMYLNFLGMYPYPKRCEINCEVQEYLTSVDIRMPKLFDLESAVGHRAMVAYYQAFSLPDHPYFIDSAIITMSSDRWPLIIDPEGICKRWITVMYSNKIFIEEYQPLICTRTSDDCLMQKIELSIKTNKHLLVEGLGMKLGNPLTSFIMASSSSCQMNNDCISFSSDCFETRIPKGWRVYFMTSIRKPEFEKTIYIKLNVIDFSANEKWSLYDYVFEQIIEKESEPAWNQHVTYYVDRANQYKIVEDLETKLLNCFSIEDRDFSQPDDCNSLIADVANLNKNKFKLNEMLKDNFSSTLKKIYDPLVNRFIALYLSSLEACKIKRFYQYSFKQLIGCVLCVIESIEASNTQYSEIEEKISKISALTTKKVYEVILSSMDAEDGLLWSFHLALQLLYTGQYKLLLSDTNFGVSLEPMQTIENVSYEDILLIKNTGSNYLWLSPYSRTCITQLLKLKEFSYLHELLQMKERVIKDILKSPCCIFDSLIRREVQDYIRVSKNIKLNKIIRSFHYIVLMRCLCPQYSFIAVQKFVDLIIHVEHVQVEMNSLGINTFSETNCSTPVIVLCKNHVSILQTLTNSANSLNIKVVSKFITPHVDERVAVEDTITQAIDNGSWVCLMDCHFGSEDLLLKIQQLWAEICIDRTNLNFRLWLIVDKSCTSIPEVLLSNSMKKTVEAIYTKKSLLDLALSNIDENYLARCKNPVEFLQSIYGLCNFHFELQKVSRREVKCHHLEIVIGDDLFLSAIVTFKRLYVLYNNLSEASKEISVLSLVYNGIFVDEENANRLGKLYRYISMRSVGLLLNYGISHRKLFSTSRSKIWNLFLTALNSIESNTPPNGEELFTIVSYNTSSNKIMEPRIPFGKLYGSRRSHTLNGKRLTEYLIIFLGRLNDTSSVLPPNILLNSNQYGAKNFIQVAAGHELQMLKEQIQPFCTKISNWLMKLERCLKIPMTDIQDLSDLTISEKIPLNWLQYFNIEHENLSSDEFFSFLKLKIEYFQSLLQEKSKLDENYPLNMFQQPSSLLVAILNEHIDRLKLINGSVGHVFYLIRSDSTHTVLLDKICPALTEMNGYFFSGVCIHNAEWDEENGKFIPKYTTRSKHVFELPLICMVITSVDDGEIAKDALENEEKHIKCGRNTRENLHTGNGSELINMKCDFPVYQRVPKMQQLHLVCKIQVDLHCEMEEHTWLQNNVYFSIKTI